MLNIYYKRLCFYKQNWKLGIHLLFRTYHFGVNNQWWWYHESMFGIPMYKRFLPSQLKKTWFGIKIRICACHFLDKDTVKMLNMKL